MILEKRSSVSVLLIGAYGNGNLGDVIQASFLCRKIKALVPHAEVFATSKSVISDYFPASHQIDPIILKNKKALNGFDIIAIGGGGLLAANHRPLYDEGWAEKIDSPLIFLGVGAEAETVEACRPLLEKALYIGARDVRSLQVLRRKGLSCSFMSDPVLASYSLFEEHRVNLFSRRTLGLHFVRRYVFRPKVLWVLRRRLLGVEKNVDYKRVLKKRDGILSVFPSSDIKSGLYANLDRPHLETFCIAEFVEILKDYDLLVSDRLHACVIALCLGIPTSGFLSLNSPYPKVFELFQSLGIEGSMITEEQFIAVEPIPHPVW